MGDILQAFQKCILLNENYSILIQISLKVIPNGPVAKTPPMVQVMGRHRWDFCLDRAMMTMSKDLNFTPRSFQLAYFTAELNANKINLTTDMSITDSENVIFQHSIVLSS